MRAKILIIALMLFNSSSAAFAADNYKTDIISTQQGAEVEYETKKDRFDFQEEREENPENKQESKPIDYSERELPKPKEENSKDYNFENEKSEDKRESASKKFNTAAGENKAAVQIGDKEIYEQINVGEEFTVTIWFKNTGNTKISDTVAVFKPSDSLAFMERSYSFKLGSLEPKEVKELDIKLKALKEADAYYLDVDFDYGYINKNVYTQDGKAEKIKIISKSTKADTEPLVIIGKDSIKSGVKAGERFCINVWFKNEGDTAVKNPTVLFSAGKDMIIVENSAFEALEDIKPKETVYKKVYLKMLDNVNSTEQSLNVNLKYDSIKGNRTVQKSISDKIIVEAVGSAEKSGGSKTEEADKKAFETPNIIIKKYTYGDSQVMPGDEFVLYLELKNTSESMDIENITMTAEPIGGLLVDSETNVFHFDKIGAGDIKWQEIKMKASEAEKSTVPFVNVSFNYEYGGNGAESKSSDVNSEIIEIPVYKPDQFEITVAETPENIYLGEELNISFNYMNKGESVSNLTAQAETDSGVFEDIRNLSSVGTGENGIINFSAVPFEAGELDIKLHINYENAMGDMVVREFPLAVNILDDGKSVYNETAEEEKEDNIALLTGIGGAFIGAAAIAVIFKFFKGKKL